MAQLPVAVAGIDEDLDEYRPGIALA